MPTATPKKLLKFLEKREFYISRQSGSHMILHHKTDRTKRITLPMHNKDLKPKTLNSILKQAGLNRKEFSKHK
ncbi:MAG: type II toxin-antitoxin system HicA family toxin [Patescibacteria group bacterium]